MIKNMTVTNNKGFSLIELMIVIAIIGVISAVAFPSYTSYMEKSRRADAKIALTKMASIQERYYLQNSTYTTTVADVGGADSDDGYYTLSIAAGADGIAEGFILTATADAGDSQANDTNCKKLILNSLGTKTSEDSSGTVDSTNAKKCW